MQAEFVASGSFLGSKVRNNLKISIKGCLVGLDDDVREDCHCVAKVYLHSFCLDSMTLVELNNSGFNLLLQPIHKLQLLRRIAHPHNLFQNLHRPSIGPLIRQTRSNMKHLESLLIQPQLLTDLKLIHPCLRILLHIELHLLNTLPIHQPHHCAYGAGELLVSKEEGDNQGREGEFVEQVFPQDLTLLQLVVDDEQLAEEGEKLFVVLHQPPQSVLRGVDHLRILEFQVRAEQLDAKPEHILLLCVVVGDDLDYLRCDIGVSYLMLDVFGEGALTLNDLVVVKQHLAPEVLFTVRNAVVVEMLLPSGQFLAHQPPPQLPKTPQTFRKHRLQSPSNKMQQIEPQNTETLTPPESINKTIIISIKQSH